MARARTKNRHLPQRVYISRGFYSYVDINNKWHKLGKTLPEAMVAWTKLIDRPATVCTMNQLFDRYMFEVAPKKSQRTYKDNQREVMNLRVYFGEMSPEDIDPTVIYQYMDIRSTKAPIRANREKSLLSHVFSMAIRWGIVKDNPCRNVKRNPEKPRDRHIEDWEYKAVWNIAPELIKAAMDFARLTGQRIGDILRVKLSDITEDGVRIDQGKTGKKLLIEWSDMLRKCVNTARLLPRPIRGLYLFCNRFGQPYTSSGFKTLWQRTMTKAIQEGVLTERFTFHDIRAKASSDIKSTRHASELLGHASESMTKKTYRRGVTKVKPSR